METNTPLSHLVNEGVEESPHQPPEPKVDEGLFIDLNGANVGLQHWHPMPVTHEGDRLAGQAGIGGVWEWTSSPLSRWEGFKPMALYPGYTGESKVISLLTKLPTMSA